MKNRLIKLINEAKAYALNLCLTSTIEECVDAPTLEEVEADYLLKNGVTAPLCKVGDTVYVSYYGRVEPVTVEKHCVMVRIEDETYIYNIDKIFLTEEEAPKS